MKPGIDRRAVLLLLRAPMRPLEERTDIELMGGAQTGQRECFAQLVRRYQAQLLRVATSRLGRGDWAEEVVQETLMAAFRSRMSFQIDRSFRTWLWTILLNQCHRNYKRRLRGRDIISLSTPPAGARDQLPISEPKSPEPSPWMALLAKERAALVDSLLDQLAEPQADALRLRFFAELKFQEIADTMGCSLLTAKNRVRWGLARMAQLLARSGEAANVDAKRGGP